MQFYPHNISTALIGNAVSASTAATGSFINNFSAIPINTVNTASLALNITGSRGADGTSVAVVGPKGATGTRGVTGFRGNSILLLSSEWHSGPPCDPVPVDCYSHVFYPTFVLGNERFCAFEEPGQTYYSTDLTLIDGSSKIYYNDICTTLASNSNPLGAYGATAEAYSTDGAGTLQFIDSCPQEPF